jgi:hypothetical protein
MYSKISFLLSVTFLFSATSIFAQYPASCFYENFDSPQSGWVLSNGAQIRNYNNPSENCGNDKGIVTPSVAGNNNIIIKAPMHISNGNDILKISFDIFRLSANMNCNSWSDFNCPTNLEISMITDNNTIAGITNLIIPQIGPSFNPQIRAIVNTNGALPNGTSYRLMIKLKPNNPGNSCAQPNAKYVLDNIQLCQCYNSSIIDAIDDNLCYLADGTDVFNGDVSLNDISYNGAEVTYSLANGPFGLNSSSVGGAIITFNANGTFTLIRTDGIESIFDFTYKMTDNASGLTDLASVRVCFTDGGPLPLTLINFGCTRNNKTAELVWNTSIESNINRFEIQRKIAGRFETVGSVQAKNSPLGSNYAFSEYNNASGITEYRLKIVENDNINRYSSIKTLKGIKGADEMEIYPMPSKGNVTIRMNEINNRASVEIINLSGSVVKKISNNASNVFEFNGLQNGFYIVKYTNNLTGNVITKKLMVVR